MLREGPPWWLYVIAAPFLIQAAIHTYIDLRGPANVGMYISYTSGRMCVTGLMPGSSAERAGLQAGDCIIRALGSPIQSQFDWLALRVNLAPRQPFDLEIERQGNLFTRTVIVEQRLWASRTATERTVTVINMVGQTIMLILAMSIVFLKPRDAVARLGALLLAGVAVMTPSPPYGAAAIWRSLPTPLGWLLWIPAIAQFLLPAVLFTFCASFPQRPFRQKWLWAAAWLPAFFSFGLLVRYAYLVIYQPQQSTGALSGGQATAIGAVFTAYGVAAIAALIFNYRRLEQVNERRRVRVMVAGCALGWIGALPWVSAFMPGSSPDLVKIVTAPAYLIVSNILFYLLFPLSVAYSIVRYRVFDIRIIIRQSLQYAVARGALVALAPAVATAFLLDLMINSSQPVSEIFQTRGWAYLVFSGVALAAHLRRKQWLEALDRRFFRECYDAQQVVRQVLDDIVQARTFHRVAPHVVAKIESAFHAEFVALLSHGSGGADYTAIAITPAGHELPPISASNKFMGLMRVLAKPIEVTQTRQGWLRDKLPESEISFLKRDRIELLVPVAAEDDTQALLALGPKRSEEPYSREDQDLLMTISKSLALLLERPPEDVAATTSREGILSGRYKLGRLLGRGGMGAVYAAVDTALDRPVAIKVLRDEFIGEKEIVERFAQEARLAAGFAHTNVVTVYDFGVAEGSRAFLVMELLQGQTLRELLNSEKRVQPSRATGIMKGVCSAVDAAHARQLIHRDLKPGNILLAQTDAGEVAKVLDFGIAKLLTSNLSMAKTATGFSMGTPHYMSPEQLRGEDPDCSWDLWALAVVAYELWAGSHPFASENESSWQRNALAGRFKPLPDQRLQQVFARAFAVDVARRPHTAGELLRALSESV